ncbi:MULTISPECIES: hypothetical protein [unclassified Pseudoalteromonas]|uniref:hypothetical protein n=1 Tax=unclassified Pseudoalteromonas TaxID=194690 RepID=UPI002098517A|nr:hypothetical protein [Pseudoalteromonas sp. XMcav2-N]MCO7188986.1 hypothetical protein [Pseudoalteromonas sp. XMcav2-N]
MERRTFLKASSYLCASGVLPVSALAADSIAFTNSEQNTQRVSGNLLEEIARHAPSVSMEAPSGESVQVTLRPSVVRRYNTFIYVYFEMSNEITVFDLSGTTIGTIKLPQGFSNVSDFAVEPNQQLLYFIERGHHQVIVANFFGEQLAQIGEFGTEVVSQLNGPKSLTLDGDGRVHVLESGTSSVKVFGNNGAFLYSYGQTRLGKQPMYKTLDGTEQIVITGGQLGDRKWVFNHEARKLTALN